MGKFLRDSQGNLVAIEGGLVLERTLDRKPRDCESCGFSKWAKGDKCFIIQGGSGMNRNSNNNNTDGPGGGFVGGGSMEWICPDCAIVRGLPIEFYHKNFFSPGNDMVRRLLEQQPGTITTATANNARHHQQVTNGGGSTIEKLLDLTSSLCHY